MGFYLLILRLQIRLKLD